MKWQRNINRHLIITVGLLVLITKFVVTFIPLYFRIFPVRIKKSLLKVCQA